MYTFRKSLVTSVIVLALASLVSFVLVVQATSKDDIVYPAKELGNCKNEAECRVFCDARDNLERVKTCVAFAKKHNLLPVEDIEEAERYVLRAGIAVGPGGCRNERECDAYCENTGNLNECLDFAERYDLRSREEIIEGRKLVVVLNQGAALPGDCRNKNECMAYCEDPSHMRECVAFAERAGFISQEEAREAQKIIPLIESGEKTPGNCARKAQCEAYCMEPAHIDECLLFAEKAGLLPPEELADAKKFAPFIKNGETPGQCKRKEECEAYCGDVAHFEECVAFAEKAGMMSREDAELARKVKGQGPGGCASKESCEAFCSAPENQETCLNFVKEHGLAGEFVEVESKIRGEVESKMMACAGKPCPELIQCLQSLQGEGNSKGGSEEDLPPEIKGKLNACVAELYQATPTGAVGGTIDTTTRGEGALSGSALPDSQCLATLNGVPEGMKTCISERTGGKSFEELCALPTTNAIIKECETKYREEQYKSQVDCSLFAAAPACTYVGPAGSELYNLCKQCFPDR